MKATKIARIATRKPPSAPVEEKKKVEQPGDQDRPRTESEREGLKNVVASKRAGASAASRGQAPAAGLVPGSSGLLNGILEARTQESVSELDAEILAARAASALTKMPAKDREVVLDGVPTSIEEVADLVVDAGTEKRRDLITRFEDKLREALARNDDESQLDDVYRAITSLMQKIESASDQPSWRMAVVEIAPTMRDLFRASALPADALNEIVEMLELLQDLAGQKDLANVSNEKLRRACEALGVVDVHGLEVQAGHALAEALYRCLERTANREGIL